MASYIYYYALESTYSVEDAFDQAKSDYFDRHRAIKDNNIDDEVWNAEFDGSEVNFLERVATSFWGTINDIKDCLSTNAKSWGIENWGCGIGWILIAILVFLIFFIILQIIVYLDSFPYVMKDYYSTKLYL